MEYERDVSDKEFEDLDGVQIKEEVKVEEDFAFCAVDCNSSIVNSAGNIFQHIFKVEGDFTAEEVCAVPPPTTPSRRSTRKIASDSKSAAPRLPPRRSTRTIIPTTTKNKETEEKIIQKVKKVINVVETTDLYVFKCFICLKSFSTAELAKTHLSYHNSDRRYVCPICKNVVRNIRGHMKTHSEDNYHNCSVCNKRLKGKKYLERHMESHTRKAKIAEKETETVEKPDLEHNQAMDEV